MRAEQFQLKPIAAAVLIGLSLSSAAEMANAKDFQVDDTTNPVLDAGGKRVAMDGLGNVVVVWGTQAYYDPQPSVVFRRYDATGAALSNAATVASQMVDAGNIPAPSTARNATGAFVIAWFSGADVLAQQFDVDGNAVGTEIVVNVGLADASSQSPRVAIDSNGNFVVAWITGGDLLGRVFGADGNPLTDEITLDDRTLDDESFGDVAMDKDGNFAVTWLSGGQVYARRFDVTGTAAADSVRADLTPANDDSFDPDNLTVDYTLHDPVIAMDEGGDFAVAWKRDQVTTTRGTKHIPKKCHKDPYSGYVYCYDPYDLLTYAAGTKSTIRVRRYNSTAASLSTNEIEVAAVSSLATYNENDTTPQFKVQKDLGAAAIAMDKDGDFAVAWVKSITKRTKKCHTDSYGYKYCEIIDKTASALQARRYKSGGSPSGIPFTVGKTTSTVRQNISPSIASSQSGDLSVSWIKQDVVLDYYGYPSYTQSFWARLYPKKK